MFFTVVTHHRLPLLATPGAVAIFHKAVEAVQRRRPFTVEALVVLSDHLHSIWTLPEDDADYSTRWRLIKEGFTRAYSVLHGAPTADARRARRGEKAVWQGGFWEHLIGDDRDFSAHLDYIHLNPVKHGFASTPRDWQHSTFLEWVARGAYETHWGADEMPPLPKWVGHE
jgi:putative transposase